MATDDTQPDSCKTTDTSRRTFLKLGVAGAGVVAAAAGGMTVVKRMEGIPHDGFPLPIREDFQRIDQRNQINVFANDLSSGTYTYSLVADGVVIATKRMVKQ